MAKENSNSEKQQETPPIEGEKEETIKALMNLVRYGHDYAANKILDYCLDAKVTPGFTDMLLGMLNEENREKFIYEHFHKFEKDIAEKKDEEIKRLKEEIRQHRKDYSDLEARFETHIGEQTEQLHHENQGLRLDNERLKKVLGLEHPWPLTAVLSQLIHASEILLDKKNYDGPDYEEMELAIKRAKEIKALSNP